MNRLNKTARVASGATTLIALLAAGSTHAASGVVQFVDPTITVHEAGQAVLLRVIRTGSRDEKSQVRWTTMNGSAIAGSDFGSLFQSTMPSGTLTFFPGESEKHILISAQPPEVMAAGVPYLRIIQSPGFEPAEEFSIQLSGPDVGPLSTAKVEIAAHGRAVALLDSRYDVPAGAGSAVITVQRIGDPAEGVSVEYRTRDISSVKARSYTPVSGSLSWPPDDTAPKQITIPLLPGATRGPVVAVEISEALNATLQEPRIAVVVMP